VLLVEPAGKLRELEQKFLVHHGMAKVCFACDGQACLNVPAREALGDTLLDRLFERQSSNS